MEYLVLLNDNNYYHIEKETNAELSIIGYFLLYDVSCHWIQSFKEWALEAGDSEMASNATNIDKFHTFITLEDQYTAEGIVSPKVVMHRDQFIRLLNSWEEVCTTKPAKIKITKHNGAFELQASNE